MQGLGSFTWLVVGSRHVNRYSTMIHEKLCRSCPLYKFPEQYAVAKTRQFEYQTRVSSLAFLYRNCRNIRSALTSKRYYVVLILSIDTKMRVNAILRTFITLLHKNLNVINQRLRRSKTTLFHWDLTQLSQEVDDEFERKKADSRSSSKLRSTVPVYLPRFDATQRSSTRTSYTRDMI